LTTNIRATIEKIVYPGKALGKTQEGFVTFVEGALPGEEVEIELFKKKSSFGQGRLLSVLRKSDKRVAPRCPSYGYCGGCSFQHTGYENQLEIKSGYVKEIFSFLGAVPEPIVPSPLIWGYRNKMEFSFFDDSGKTKAGLHTKGQFNRFIEVPPCYICDENFNKAVEKITAFAQSSGLKAYDRRAHSGFFRHLVLKKGVNTGQALVNLVTNELAGIDKAFFDKLAAELRDCVTSFYWTVNAGISDAVVPGKTVLLSGKELINEKLTIMGREYSFAVSPFSFFQTNAAVTEKLFETALEMIRPAKNESLLELYSGMSVIGIIMSGYFGKVTSVEESISCIEDAKRNFKLNNTDNIRLEHARAEQWVSANKGFEHDALVLDPPRSGMSNKVLDFIKRSGPKKVVYISCNPATLSRDLKALLEEKTYRIERVVPFDMFPQNFHVETAVALIKC
jgi:23S rRNA (uracil1939-C5)-methyltransferase